MNHKIIIADDHPIFRTGIREIVNNIQGITCCGEAKDGLEAYQLIQSIVPDIAILDLDMPILSGLDVCEKVKSEKHNTRCIILTMHKDKHFFEEAMLMGAMGYLLKDNAIEELILCIRSVTENKKYVSRKIEEYLTQYNSNQQLPDNIKQLYATLTPTEKIIIKLISQSSTSQEIANNLFISKNTVENHRANITKKLKLEGKNSLLKFALQYKNQL
jgi:DNA-binding NarL/FixJ family response regulator